ncbi:MAG: hypothetical protein IKI77_11180 [Oscillospiraceae bacterium]|nr:hypothetical protein [Oscillospiraceae bacterium]
MKDKTFDRLLTAVLIIGSISVIALLVYTELLRRDVSIISYIANGR